jgi:hypothetical protein
VEFRISREYPLVSLVAMLAPSPDWFVGVSALDLCEGGRWAAERTVELFAYDAGTDSGSSYESPDADAAARAYPTNRDAAFPRRRRAARGGYADLFPDLSARRQTNR